MKSSRRWQKAILALVGLFLVFLLLGCVVLISQEKHTTSDVRTHSFLLLPNEGDGIPVSVHGPGTIRARAEWQGQPKDLELLILAPVADEPIKRASGPSPLQLGVEVTKPLLRSGVTWWVRVQGTVKAPLSGNLRVTYPGTPLRKGTLRLRSGDVLLDDRSTKAFIAELAARPNLRPLPAFIRLKHLPDAGDQERLEKGGIYLHQFLSDRTYRATVEPRARLKAGAVRDLVEAVAAVRPELKIEPRIALGQFSRFAVPDERSGEERLYVLNADGSVNLTVIFVADIGAVAATGILKGLTRQIRQFSDRAWVVTMRPELIQELARQDLVEWIEAAPVPALRLNDRTRLFIQVDPLHAIDTTGKPPSYDYSGGGDKDLLVGAGDGTIRLFLNVGTDAEPVYVPGASLQAGGANLDVGERAAFTFGDRDRDADLDLVVGNDAGNVLRFENTGTDAAPVYAPGVIVQAGGADICVEANAAPVLWDANLDGIRDLVVGAGDGRVWCFLNNALSDYSQPDYAAGITFQAGGSTLDAGEDACPVFHDLDDDGDWDLIVGNAEGLVTWYRNDGTNASPLYAAGVPIEVGGAPLDVGDGAAPSFHDFDQDRRQDLAVGNALGEVRIFRNTGTSAAPVYAPGVSVELAGASLIVGSHAFPVWRDMDLDGIRVVNLEGSAEWRHSDFEGRVVYRAEVPPGGYPHGTHVLGTMAGSGARSHLFNVAGIPNGGTLYQWRGMLPEAGLVFLPGYNPAASRLHEVFAVHGAHLSNVSLAISSDGDYNATNQLWDDVVRGDATHNGAAIPAASMIAAAGNSNNPSVSYGQQRGYFSLWNQFKNVVVVGAWRDRSNPPIILKWSSLGPTHDGRIKPDLVAPGVSVKSSGSLDVPNGVYHDSYVSMSGTSMASPAVAGTVGLLLEAWRRAYAVSLADVRPLPSTLRGLLIHTAEDIDWVNDAPAGFSNPDFTNVDGPVSYFPGPDFATGWGLVNAQAAVETVENRLILESQLESTCDVIEFPFTVASAQDTVTITLAWDDPASDPAGPLTEPHLINDLDLEIVDPSGTVHYPFALNQTITLPGDASIVLMPEDQTCGTAIQVITPVEPDPAPSNGSDYPNQDIPVAAAPPGRDHLNNVEKVVTSGPAGMWIARVSGFAIAMGPQPFSLIGVPDSQAPVITCPATYTVEATGPDGVSSAELAPSLVGVSASDAGDPAPDISHDAADPLALGMHPVNFTATDAAGNAASCQVEVVVVDTTPPVLGCADPFQEFGATGPSGLSLDVPAWLSYLDSFAAQDLVDPDPSITHNAPDPLPIGEHEVTFRAIDQSGNTTTCIATVRVLRPADTVLVLDDTFSMTQPAGVAGGPTKIESLRGAVAMFEEVLGEFRQGLGDQIGALNFKVPPQGAATEPCQPGWSQNLVSLGALEDSLPQIPPAVNGMLVDGWATPIRPGLQAASTLLAQQPDWRRRLMILLSDGKENTPNCMIGPDPADIASFRQTQISGRDIRLLAVGFGAETQIDAGLLTQLATDGFYDSANSDQELDKWFAQAIAAVLEQEVMLDPKGLLAPGGSKTADVPLTSHTRSVTLLLSWQNKESVLDLYLIPPGEEISKITAGPDDLSPAGVTAIEGPTYKALILRFPLGGKMHRAHAGTWRAVVSRPAEDPGPAEPYSLVVLADSPLQFRLLPPNQPPATSQTLSLLVRLSGLDLADARVTVELLVPTRSLGQMLADQKLTGRDVAVRTRQLGSDFGPLVRRTELLKQSLGAMFARRAVHQLELFDDGQHGDGKPSDGIFGTEFGPLQNDGSYTSVFRTEGRTREGEVFRREFSRGFYVPVKVSHTKTRIVVDRAKAGMGRIMLLVTPRDDNGTLLGPGYAHAITLELDKHISRWNVKDQGDGSYHLNVETDPKVAPSDVMMRILGTAVPVTLIDRQ